LWTETLDPRTLDTDSYFQEARDARKLLDVDAVRIGFVGFWRPAELLKNPKTLHTEA
jgi:hypothetical protein